jgi:tRNA A-37 threonylcarbamoyl transferase component Bud32
MSDSPAPPPLSPAEARRIDQVCDRFEADWKAGRRPAPEEYLGTTGGPGRPALLRQLLLLDWDYRRRAGDEPRPEDYHTRFPDDTALIEAVCREMSEPSADTSAGTGGPEARPAAGPGLEAGADRYELLHEVGRGGIGVVFRGRDHHLRRDLAVKVLREDHRDRPGARRRFLEEARVGSQLQHPAIVPVYELGWFDDRRPYFTMKLVEGHTLAAPLQRRAGPGEDLPHFLGIFEQVCQAVAYAHARGVVHRDLKPANVMVGAFGKVHVMDCGFAKVLAAEGASGHDEAPPVRGAAGLSQSGSVLGTPAYMPPEQARGEADLLDARADMFALGAILCEILTGRPPYAEGTADEVSRQAAAGDLDDAYARLDACGADEALRELARRCLAADRLARPADAGAVARDLTAYLASAQERLRQTQLERAAAEARAQEAGAKAKAERRARRLTLALAAAAVVLLALAGAGWRWREGVREAEAARRANAERQARAALNTARTLLAENKLAPAREQLARARAQLGNEGPALAALAAEVEAGAAELDRFQRFLDLIDRAHQAETAPVPTSTLAANSPHGSAEPAPATTVGRRPAAAAPFLLEALERYHVLSADGWDSALEGGLLGGQQAEQIRRLANEELLWLADDVLTRQRGHRSGRPLSPEVAARAALNYLGRAEGAGRPTRALYALRARCRKALGEEAAARADTQRAEQTPRGWPWTIT